MIDELKEEEIVNKVGDGSVPNLDSKTDDRFEPRGRALVEARGVDKMICRNPEIMQEKIYLDLSGKLRTVELGLRSLRPWRNCRSTQPGD